MALSIESRALSIESRSLSIESRENISDDKLKIVKLESKIVKLKSKKKSKDEKITKLKLEIKSKDEKIEKITKLELEIKSKDEEITELVNKLYINDEEFANEYFKFGKYKGKSFKHVAINYPAYAGIIELQAPSKHFRDFLRFFYSWKLNEFSNI
tara:strand:+ start:165 stop:629 length:465 start_codon:yes stop_codon:yes gene_type:complete